MIAQGDTVGFFRESLVALAPEIRLDAFTDDIKGVARADVQGFALWRVVDAVFADEFRATILAVSLAIICSVGFHWVTTLRLLRRRPGFQRW